MCIEIVHYEGRQCYSMRPCDFLSPRKYIILAGDLANVYFHEVVYRIDIIYTYIAVRTFWTELWMAVMD